MKKLLSIIALSITLFACNTSQEKDKKNPEEQQKKSAKVYDFPEDISKVLKKHGGIEAWDKNKTLSYKVKGEEHTIDLHSRKTTVTSENYALGFDGKEVWLAQQDSTAFKGNPKFYYNLYFYFYAMPFVLADDGIVYTDAAPFVYEGVSYPGIKIGYKADVGMSPEDNYFIYYNPETYQMEWLGYTVTYFSKKTSEKVKMIRYDNWEDVNGFLLPKSITWYKKDKEDGILKPTEKELPFSSALVSQAAMADGFYANQNK